MTIKHETAIKFQQKNEQTTGSIFISLLDHTRYAIPAEIYINQEIAW